MKRGILSIVILMTLAFMLTSCGASSNTSGSSGAPSKLKTRAFVTNSFAGLLQIIDYTRDTESLNNVISAGSQPGMMVETPDRKSTLVFDSLSNAIDIIDNGTEAALVAISLPASTNSIVVAPDSKTAYAATRNAPVSGQQNGAVQVVDLTTATLGTQIPVPLANSLALSPDGNKMLVFGAGIDQANFIDLTPPPTGTTATTPVAVAVTGQPMSRPVAAVFTSDGTKAYVANCGSECGGTGSAGISVVDMTANPPSASAAFSVAGASTMLFDGTTLYVAGQNSLTVLTPSGNTFTLVKGPVAIGAGFHTSMLIGADNTLFIGATGCPDGANVPDAGCLSMYSTSANDVRITTGGKGPVTGMAAIPHRSVVYVVEGGELDIYDTKTRAVQVAPCPGFSCFIDIVGKAVDVKVIDQ